MRYILNHSLLSGQSKEFKHRDSYRFASLSYQQKMGNWIQVTKLCHKVCTEMVVRATGLRILWSADLAYEEYALLQHVCDRDSRFQEEEKGHAGFTLGVM